MVEVSEAVAGVADFGAALRHCPARKEVGLLARVEQPRLRVPRQLAIVLAVHACVSCACTCM